MHTILLTTPATAAVPAQTACQTAIAAVEQSAPLPSNLLAAIAAVESGRPGVARSWPWTVNAGGKGYYLESRDEAVALVRSLRAQGLKSIDVGCMQVNLYYHPQAFATVEEAFDPPANVAYAAHFLRTLRVQLGDWERAIGHYHSADPVRGGAYRTRVLAAADRINGAPLADGWQRDTVALTFAEVRQGNRFRQAIALQRLALQRDPPRNGRPPRIVIIGDGAKAPLTP